MQDKKLSTAERILHSALQLMKDKGFNLVTMKEIAEAANVSEMTVFRHFETKKRVLEKAIERNKVIPDFTGTFEENLHWELEEDLRLIAHLYLDLMEKNDSICLIAIQERSTMPELIDLISDNTEQLKRFISAYFTEMQTRNEIIQLDSYVQASSFLAMLFSFFISTALWDKKFINVSKKDFIENSVKTFCYGIKK